MSTNLPRVTQKIFGENAGQNIGQFGSALAGQGNPTGDIEEIQALPAWAGGWNSAVISERDYPPLEEMTGIQKVETQQIAYIFQKGIPEWDEGTTYFANISFCQINGIVYRSLTDNNLGNNPEIDSTNWEVWKPLEGTYANIDLSNLSSTGEAHFANPDLSNLTSTGQAILDSKLNKTQITNCILEIPQDIKLELTNGVLKLKAGSTVYIPNGVGNFDTETISNDITVSLSTVTGAYRVFYRKGSNLAFANQLNIKSGSTPTSNIQGMYYDTTLNKISFYQNNTTGDGNLYSFPLAEITITNGVCTSINQIFNGLGYIGSTVFVLPNLKVLLCDGRNVDGTLNNCELNISQCQVYTTAITLNDGYLVIGTNTGTVIGFGISPRYETDIPNTILGTFTYNRADNYIYARSDTGSDNKRAFIASISVDSGNITSFKANYPFRAVDYNDFYDLQNSSANTSLTNLTNGLANVICTTAPEIKNYGVNIAGSLTNDNNVLSGFSTTNYATINSIFNPSNNSWEINLKFTTGSDVTTQQNILSFNQTTEWNFNLSNGHFSLYIGTNDVTSGTYTILSNSIYYIKIQYSNGSFTVKYSLNGTSYTQDITRIYTLTIPSDGVFSLGHDLGDSSGSQAFKGSIDLNDCNILINNSQIWQGLTATNNVYPTVQTPAVVVDSYINGTSGYRVYSDGYCEQWGYVLSVKKTATITLLKEMIDTNYSIICTGTEATGGNDNGSMNAYNPTTTGFNIYNTSDNVSNCYWRVYGYIS